MSAEMDSSSDDDNIVAIVNLNNEFFYTYFFDESDTKSDDDADLMMAVESILHEKTRPTYLNGGAPCWAEPPIWTTTGRMATRNFTPTTSTRKWRCTETIFDDVFGCQESYLGELLKVFASTTHISDASRMPQVNLASLHIKNARLLYECLLME
jgi:hypothetical protein